MLVSTAAIILNNILAQTYNILHETFSVPLRLETFLFSFVIYTICQFVVLRYIGKQPTEILQNSSGSGLLYVVTKTVQYFLLAAMLFLILELLLNASYAVIALVIIATISYSYAIAILLFFSIQFFYWLRRDRNKTVILFAISAILLVLNLSSSLAYAEVSLFQLIDTYNIRDHPGNDNRNLTENPLLFYLYLVSSISSFVASWLASVYLLKSYYRSFASIFYWIIVTIPLLYFVSQYTPIPVYLLERIFTTPAELILAYNILYTTSEAIGGVLIGLSFWITGKKLSNYRIRKYLYISGCGYVLLFTSNYVINVTNLTYPPFGISGIPYVALASYLIFIGIYYSAMSVAQDVEIRKFIKRSVLDKGIVGSIGRAESYRQIESRIIHTTKEHSKDIEQQTGIESNVQESDIKEYIEQVLSEIKKSHRPT